MTLTKMSISLYAITLTFFSLVLFSFPAELKAQREGVLRLSGGASIGYAPEVTLGSDANGGLVTGIFGELEYGKLVGRLQYTHPFLSTFKEDNNLNGGKSYHGSLGYRADFTEQFSVAFLLSGGATAIKYSNGINGSTGDVFTNVSPQVGVNLLPAYQISDLLSVQAGIRYYKGFEVGDRTYATDLLDIAIGVRLSIGK